jgi:hypothetical protein
VAWRGVVYGEGVGCGAERPLHCCRLLLIFGIINRHEDQIKPTSTSTNQTHIYSFPPPFWKTPKRTHESTRRLRGTTTWWSSAGWSLRMWRTGSRERTG